jgi:hypothetical protein
MPGLIQRDAAPVGGLPRRSMYLVGGVVVAMLLVLLVGSRLVSSPKHVQSITVRNDTAFVVRVATSNQLHGAETPLGVIGANATATFSGVADEGSTWFISTSSEGVDAGTVAMSRSDLARAHWTITIGPDVDAKFRAAGLTP